MLKKIALFLFICTFLLFNVEGQTSNIKVYNKYIHTSNEYVHGMLIIHRILENLNQEVNKFVDLQSSQFNFYGNKDLPKDIFMDPEGWFYETPPSQLKIELSSYQQDIPLQEHKSLQAFINEMSDLAAKANSLRFELEAYINGNDLTLDKNQIEVFKKLENCEYVYDRFFEVKENLQRFIDATSDSREQASNVKDEPIEVEVFFRIQKNMKKILDFWHFGIEAPISSIKDDLDKDLTYLNSLSFSNKHLKDAITAFEFSLQILDNYLKGKEIPQKYDLYGSDYFYHNVELLSCLNKYGKGFVINCNKLLSSVSNTSLFLFEEPHYFKVVYPKKEVDLSLINSSINLLPAKVEQRNVVIKQQIIEVESEKVLLEIFDHKKEDGDIVSLNFNGKWILQKKKLAKRPFKFVIELNPSGENYLLLHAENLGSIPPNTIAVRYYIEGRPKLVVLNSDLDQSEMILLKASKN